MPIDSIDRDRLSVYTNLLVYSCTLDICSHTEGANNFLDSQSADSSTLGVVHKVCKFEQRFTSKLCWVGTSIYLRKVLLIESVSNEEVDNCIFQTTGQGAMVSFFRVCLVYVRSWRKSSIHLPNEVVNTIPATRLSNVH